MRERESFVNECTQCILKAMIALTQLNDSLNWLLPVCVNERNC